MAEEKAIESGLPEIEDDSETSNVTRQHFWTGEVDVERGDLLLLACCFTTGLLDCSTFRNWVVFVSMQTGNTIILCLSSAGLPEGQPWAWAATLTSLIAFFAGAFICTWTSGFLGATRRIVLVINVLLQAVLIAVAASLATGRVTISDNDGSAEWVLHNPRILISIGPLAFQSGMTIATSRLLGFGNQIPVTVYTSTYAALAADPKLFHLRGNKPRDRRVAAIICVFAGAFVATWAEKRSAGIIVTFWMSAGIKLILAAAVAFLFPRK